MAALDAGEWPASNDPAIRWSCHFDPNTWQGGLQDITDCCNSPVRDVVLHHIDRICGMLCELPTLETQGLMSRTVTFKEATSIILSPHGRGMEGLVGEAWKTEAQFHESPTCNCVYDKTTPQTDTLYTGTNERDTGLNEDQSHSVTVDGAAARDVEQEGGEETPMYNDGLFTNIHDEGGLLTKGRYPYDPTISLTPSGFHGRKNLTIQKMSIFPDYYNHIRKVLPNSVFMPLHEEGLAKETVCLTLIIEADRNGLIDLSNELKQKLHPELKDTSLLIMKHRLAYLIELAENDPMAKIRPECIYEAQWFRNRSNNQGFKAWREEYDETYSSYKGKNKTGGCTNSETGNGTKPKTPKTQKGKTYNVNQNFGGNNHNLQGLREPDLDAPVVVNIRPSDVLKMVDEVMKLGFETSTRQQRLKTARDQLGKLNTYIPVPISGVQNPSSTITSGALTSQNQIQSQSGKRDHSLDGQESSKRRRNNTARIQAGVKSANQGAAKHQAEMPAQIIEKNNPVPLMTNFPSNDVRSRFHRQGDRSQDRGRQSRGTTGRGGSSQRSQPSDQASHLTEMQDPRKNWQCLDCGAWNVGCSQGCQMCRIQKLIAQLERAHARIFPRRGRY